VDGLRTYDDLLSWSRQAGFLSPADSDHLVAVARQVDRDPASTLNTARSLREAIFDVFQNLSNGHEANPTDLATIATLRVEGMTHASLLARPEGFVFAIAPEVESLARPLWLIAESATQVLLSNDWRRVRLCPGDACGWLFLDGTKNGNRRWCDSADCGNRARGRAYTQRHRRLPQPDSM
jgi:predicted RNA-binding Zn ribbon-like protein